MPEVKVKPRFVEPEEWTATNEITKKQRRQGYADAMNILRNLEKANPQIFEAANGMGWVLRVDDGYGEGYQILLRPGRND